MQNAESFWMFRVGQGGQRALARSARQETRGDVTPDHAWKVGGMFYVNRNDPAIWVEKRNDGTTGSGQDLR